MSTAEQDDAKTRVLALVREMAEGAGPIEADTELLASGALDSLSVMRLVGALETAFDTRIPMLDLTIENLSTPAAITAMIQRIKAA